MKKITKLSEKLTACCPYPRMWDANNCDGTEKPVSELGYLRCYHDGYWWCRTAWPVHQNLFTQELGDEFDAVYDAFTRSFKDSRALRVWCSKNANKTGDYDTFDAYYEGELGFYWFHMITRRGDYNLYLHCYSKAEMERM